LPLLATIVATVATSAAALFLFFCFSNSLSVLTWFIIVLAMTTTTTDLLPILSSHSLTSKVYNLGHASALSIFKFIEASNSTNGLQLLSLEDMPQSSSELFAWLGSCFTRYQIWWLDLVKQDPIHVLIETILISFLAYLFFYQKKKNIRKKMKDRLSDSEIQDLLEDWKENGRLPLSYDNSSSSDNNGINGSSSGSQSSAKSLLDKKSPMDGVIIEKMVGSKLTLSLPGPGSTTNVTTTVSKLLNKGKDSKAKASSKTITALNFATHDFLGMSCPDPGIVKKDVVKEASIEALTKYGCGSCGPRGFYGTIDAHLDLEEAIAEFTKCDGAILYSDGASCAASTVAAFAKRGDLLVVDEGVYEALGSGITLSRANVKYFKHNDMQDLRRVLERIRATDESLGRKKNDQRRFIVVEALYKNYGTVCPLDELVKLKEEFCYRVMLDESYSFGTMGSTGRGLLEHHGLKPMQHVEIITISLENSMGSIGGITVGNEEIVDHQRLSGAGYCFSASLPPFLATAAQASLKRLETQPTVLETLKDNVEYFYDQLQEQLVEIIPKKLMVTSKEGVSPIVFLQHTKDEDNLLTAEERVDKFDEIARKCLDNGVYIIPTGRHVTHHLHKIPPPALRMTITAHQSKAELDTAIKVLKDAATSILG